jgi:uncharacterized membrane protein
VRLWFHRLLLGAFTLLLLIVLTGRALPEGWSLLSHVCHQHADRSFHIFGHQMGVCCRCAGVYLGFWLSLLPRLSGNDSRDTSLLPGILSGLALMLPNGVDLAAKVTLGLSAPGFLRFVFGLCYGIGCGVLIRTLEGILQPPRESAFTVLVEEDSIFP